MKRTPFGYIEKWTNAKGVLAWRGKFEPFPTNPPEYRGVWEYAKTEKRLVELLRSMCKCQLVYCNLALEEDEKATNTTEKKTRKQRTK